MKTVSVYDAVGTVLAHDVTQIIPGEFKGSRFKKGHLVRDEDIPVLLSMGKQNLFIIETGDDDVHENEAAMRIAAAATGSGITLGAPDQGKVELFAAIDGLLKIDTKKLFRLFDQDELAFATIHQNQYVNAGEKLAGTRVIPLFVKEHVVATAEEVLSGAPMIDVVPLKRFRVGVVTTGSEVFSGRIQDSFGPVLEKKFKALGSEVVRQIFTDDDEEMIITAIHKLLAENVDMIALTGGMSVDPDDRTPSAIRKAGANVVTYGVPVFPGAMFLLAYIDGVPVIGLPGCVMYRKTSIFELVVPRLLAGERPTREELKGLAHGGLCRDCNTCMYPNCGFGKSIL